MNTRLIAALALLVACGDPASYDGVDLEQDELARWDAEEPSGPGGKAPHVTISGLEWRASHSELQGIYHDCPQGSTCTITLTATNTGTSTISYLTTSWSHSGANAGSYASVYDDCSGTTLAPGDDCDVDIVYTLPYGTAKAVPGDLTFHLPGGILAPRNVDYNNGSQARIATCVEDDDWLCT